MSRRFARLVGAGGYLPGDPVSNAALVALGLETSDEWIRGRTGIAARHFAKQEATSDMALQAAKKALQQAGWAPDELDLIVVATTTPDWVFPSTATLLHAKLGCSRPIAAFDLQAVCAGFLYGLVVAQQFIASGSARRVLVVGSERFSRLLDFRDRSTAVLFGDGAGAVAIAASDEPGVLATYLSADGRYHAQLAVPAAISQGAIEGYPFVQMQGQTVFRFAVQAMSEACAEVLKQAGVSAEQVRWLVLHQANVRILDAVAKRLGIPDERVVKTVTEHGNTSAASVPLALAALSAQGAIQRGDHLLVAAVGGGFAWGAALLRW